MLDNVVQSTAEGVQKVGAISVAVAGDDLQRHAGLVLKPVQYPDAVLVHLAWHNRLEADPVPDSYYLVPSKTLDDDVQDFLADWMWVIYEVNKPHGIPYGFDEWHHAFGDDKIFAGMPGTGLTCATYVLACLANAELILVDSSTWPERRDTKDQRRLVGWLRFRSTASEDHLAAQWQLVGNRRFRPEEVAAAFNLYGGEPLSFELVEPASIELLQHITAPKETSPKTGNGEQAPDASA